MFFLKKEDRAGRALPPAARDSARKIQARRLGGLNPLGNSRGFRSWRVPGPILTLSWLILAFKTPPRASKTSPRGSKSSPRLLKRVPRGFKSSPRVLKRAQKDSKRAPRGSQEGSLRALQEGLKRSKEVSRGFQELPRGPHRLQETSKSSQEASNKINISKTGDSASSGARKAPERAP